jgi:hypothetical protein
MKIDKKRLRDIIVNHVNENGIPLTHIVKEKPWMLGWMRDLLSRGRRQRGTDEHLTGVVWYCAERTLTAMGYKVSSKCRNGQVCVNLFSWGPDNIWVQIPKEIAEKILVFGVVPNLKE